VPLAFDKFFRFETSQQFESVIYPIRFVIVVFLAFESFRSERETAVVPLAFDKFFRFETSQQFESVIQRQVRLICEVSNEELAKRQIVAATELG